METKRNAQLKKDRKRGWGRVDVKIHTSSKTTVRLIRVRDGTTWDHIVQRASGGTVKRRVLVDGERVQGDIVFDNNHIDADIYFEQRGGGKAKKTPKKNKLKHALATNGKSTGKKTKGTRRKLLEPFENAINTPTLTLTDQGLLETGPPARRVVDGFASDYLSKWSRSKKASHKETLGVRN